MSGFIAIHGNGGLQHGEQCATRGCRTSARATELNKCTFVTTPVQPVEYILFAVLSDWIYQMALPSFRAVSSFVAACFVALSMVSCGGLSSGSNQAVPPPPGKLSITTTSLPSGVIGAAYSSALTAQGGKTPYSWSVSSGSLAPGLTLAASGTISGTPSSSGQYSFTVKVADSSSPNQSGSAPLTLSITSSSTLSISTKSLPSGIVGDSYSSPLNAAGGTPPYTWVVSSGTLAPGLTLAASGTISGTPSSSGQYSFTVKVTDSSSPSQSASAPLTLSITSSSSTLSISTESLPSGIVGDSYSSPLNAAGGTPPYTWAVSSGTLAPGLTMAASGTISGTPSSSGQYSFTVKVTDSSSPTQSASASLSISIASGLNATQGATATQYVMSYTASNTNQCTIEVSTSSTYTPLVHAVDPAIFADANMDGQTNAGGRAFVVGQKWIAQENGTRPVITVGSSGASRASNSHLVAVSYPNQPFVVGDNITIVGMSNSAYNDSWARVDVASTNSFSYEVLTKAPSGGDTSGGGSTARADRYSLALTADTTYYYRIGGPSNTCGATPATGTFTTMNIPNGNTWAEGPIVDSSGLNQVFPSIFEDRTTIYNDPLTGAAVKRLGLYGDGGVGGGSGVSAPWTDGSASGYPNCGPALSNGGYHCWIGQGQSYVGGLYWINPTTGEVRFLGLMSSTFSDSTGHYSNSFMDSQTTSGDNTNPNRFYWIVPTNGGNTPYKIVLGYIDYTGDDVAVTTGQQNGTKWTTADPGLPWDANGGVLKPLTPDPSNTLSDLMNACATTNTPAGACYQDSNFKANKFSGCKVFEVIGDYIKIQCASYQQDNLDWLWVYSISTNAIVAGAPTYANPVLRWCGEHQSMPDFSTQWFNDNPKWANQGVEFDVRLNSSVTSGTSSFSVTGAIGNWAALTAYNGQQAIVDSNGNVQQAGGSRQGGGAGGTSGSTQPTWNSSLGGTTNDGTVTWTNMGATNHNVGEPQNLYPVKGADGVSWNYVQPALGARTGGTGGLGGGTYNGDLFVFSDGQGAGAGYPGEIVRLVTKGSCSGPTCLWSSVTRGVYGTSAASHSLGATVQALCENEANSLGAEYWNFADDPTRSDTSFTNLLPMGYTADQSQPGAVHAGHGTIASPNFVNDYDVSISDSNWSGTFLPSVIGALPNFTVQPRVSFAGHFTDSPGVSNQNYLSWNSVNSSFKDSFADALLFLGTIEFGAGATSVTGHIWKFVNYTDVSVAPALPYLGMQGLSMLKNISGPGSLLPNTGSSELCMTQNAGECWSGSNPGDIYADLSSLDSPYSCQIAGENGPYRGHDLCVLNPSMYGNAISQMGTVAGNSIGTDPRGVEQSDSANSRRLVQLMSGGWRLASEYDHVIPDSSWVTFESCVADPHINVNGSANGGSTTDIYGCQEFMAKIPPQPPADGIDRTNYESVTVTIGAGSGSATHARVMYGYEENEPARETIWPPVMHFYCTQYQGTCYSSDQNLPLNSQQALQIGVPQRVIFYEVEYLNSSNQVVASDPMTAVAIP